ncbi:MAG: hypothetical protein HON94_11990 [Methylococcales bacterium]|nr:hypothetical protein [Methylococcales bacterium]
MSPILADQQQNPEPILSVELYEQFAKRLVNKIKSGNHNYFIKSVNGDGLFQRAFKDFQFDDDEEQKAFIKKIKNSLNEHNISLFKHLGYRDDIKFIRILIREKAIHALIRLNFANKSLGYIELVLQQNDYGDVSIVDWYDYSQGDFYSVALRQLTSLVYPSNQSIWTTLFGTKKPTKKTIDQLVDLAEMEQNKKYKDWLEAYKILPEYIQNSRLYLTRQVAIASLTKDQGIYKKALYALAKDHKQDVSLTMVLLDYYFYNQQYDDTVRILESFNLRIGGDAGIYTLISSILYTQKNYFQAIANAKGAILADRSYKNAYWSLLRAYLITDNYRQSINMMNQLVRRFKVKMPFSTIEKHPEYSRLIKSSDYKRWKRRATK